MFLSRLVLMAVGFQMHHVSQHGEQFQQMILHPVPDPVPFGYGEALINLDMDVREELPS